MSPVCRTTALVGVLPALLVSSSCAPIPGNASKTTEQVSQSSDALTGTGNILKTAFRATAVAAVKQPVTTARLGLVSLWERPGSFLHPPPAAPFSFSRRPPPAPGSPEFEHKLDKKGFPRAGSGSLKWLINGPAFFPELDRQIAAARQSVDVQMFIFDNDDIGVRYAETLKNRSAEVPVRVLFDDLGSTFAWTAAPDTLGPPGFVPPSDMEEFLTSGTSRVRVRRTINPWLVCDHSKLLVFDGHTAILGGMNIGREYFSEWHDLMVRVEGPVVASLTRDFNRSWRKAGPLGDFGLFRKPAIFHRPGPVTDGIPIRVLRTDPAEGHHEIVKAMLLAIRSAQKRVWIENPYFAYDIIASACEDAARRGVEVRVIIPNAGDSVIMDAGNLATARGLIRAGAKVFRYPRMTHMKVMLCDDWACVGSANLDTLSLRINRELNIAFSQAEAVRSLESAVFLPDFSRCRRMSLEETSPDNPTPGGALAEALARQL